jgi:hypothetical protein
VLCGRQSLLHGRAPGKPEGDGRDRRGQDLLLLCDEIDGEDRRASRRLLQSQAGVL